ncbi:MAG: transposase-like protein, partial [Verrucomicrobiales bacterium]
MKMKTRKQYTDEFKAQAVALAKLGKPVSEVAKDLEIPADLVYRWKKEDAQ